METSDAPLLSTVDDGIAVLTLNRPKVLNALNGALLAELEARLAALDADTSVRAVILTGSGERAFAAGADIGELNALPAALDGEAQGLRGQRITGAMERMRVPLIAAVNGFALGGGCELALACDIRVAATNAQFGQPEVALGITPGYGGTQRLTRLIGRGAAMYLCLTGERIDAAEALRLGLVHRVVAAGELLPEARRIAATIAKHGPLAVAATKRAIAVGSGMTLADGLAFEAAQFGLTIGSADFREGTRAFLDKRAPRFEGR